MRTRNVSALCLSLLLALALCLLPSVALAGAPNASEGGEYEVPEGVSAISSVEPTGLSHDEIAASTTANLGQDGVALSAMSASWQRLSGSDRYGTMDAIANASFSQSSWAVIACGNNYPDALAASALAGARNCPILLTGTSELAAQARTQLQRLGVTNAYIVGGTAAVGDEVASAVEGMGIAIKRVAGADRVQTSLAVLKEVQRIGGVVDESEDEDESAAQATVTASDTVIVAAGNSFADALSIGPWAYVAEAPIVLTQGDGTLTAEAVAAIQSSPVVRHVLIVGGTAVVSDSVSSQLGNGYTYERRAGDNRYATSRSIAEWELAQGLSLSSAVVTTGQNFPDALSGSALCGQYGSVLVLANGMHDTTLALLADNRDAIGNGFILGGTAAFAYDDPIWAWDNRDAAKLGYQNPAGFYQVSSQNVTITSAATAPWNYITPSRIGVWATRDDCVNAFLSRAREYLGTPYVWDYSCAPGVGVDCIGLVYQCAYACGMDMGGGTGYADFNPWAHYITGYSGWHSHDANNFWDYGSAMHVGLDQRLPGDVISWPGHVAVYMGDDTIIEAYSTSVVYASLWAHGTPRGCIRLFQ